MAAGERSVTMPRHGTNRSSRRGKGYRRDRHHGTRSGPAPQPDTAAAFHDRGRRRHWHWTFSWQRAFREAGWSRRDPELYSRCGDRAGSHVGAGRNGHCASGGRLVRRLRGNVCASVGWLCHALFVLAGASDRHRQRNGCGLDLLQALVPRSAILDLDCGVFSGAHLGEREQRFIVAGHWIPANRRDELCSAWRISSQRLEWRRTRHSDGGVQLSGDGNRRGHFRGSERSGDGIAARDALDVCAPRYLLHWRTCGGSWRRALDSGRSRRKSLCSSL